MDKILNLYVLTHCESCYNKRGIFTGRIDSVLTKNGHLHAKLLAKKLSKEKIDIAFVSQLKRSRQTLEHILRYHPETEIIVDERIVEKDYGELSGKSRAKYEREHPDLYPLYHRSYNVAAPGGESMAEVEKRVMPFIKEVVEMMKEKKVNVLIVAHSNSVRPIRRYFENLTENKMMELENYRHKIFSYQVRG